MPTIVIEEVVGLADDFADDFLDCMDAARSTDELRRALAGTFLAFFAEAAAVVSQ